MDDNIFWFKYFNRNRQFEMLTPLFFRYMEDFVLRYTNILMAGPQYVMFVPTRRNLAVYEKNTRIYSCNLIKNNMPLRWRGRYNEDTILSLDILSKGFCTVQFNQFLQQKAQMQSVKGGNYKIGPFLKPI
jgi:hypothetical protein